MTTPKAPEAPTSASAATEAPKQDFSHIKSDRFYLHAGNHSSSPELLHHIATHPEADQYDLRNVASNPNASEDTLRHVHDNILHAKDDDGNYKVGSYDRRLLSSSILENPNTPKELVESSHDRLDKKDFLSRSYGMIAFHPNLDHHKVTSSFKRHTNNFEEINDRHGDVVEAYAKHPETTSDHMEPFVNSPHRNIRKAAMHSPNLTLDQQKKIWSNKELSHSEKEELLDNHKHLGPEFIQHAHDDLRSHLTKLGEALKANGTEEADLEYDSDYRDAHSALESSIKHSKAPKSIIDHYLNSSNEDLREAAIHNPSLDRDKLHEMVKSGDDHAMSAFWDREREAKDIHPDLMRKIHSRIEPDKSKYSTLSQRNLIHHPSTPEDVLKERADIGSYAAQEVLKRKDLSPELLKHIVTKGPKAAALQALKHGNVNEEVVQAGLDRKMKDINQAASLHSLAPKEAKFDKFLKDEATAHAGLDNLRNDPEFVKHVADKFAHTDEKMALRLLHNKHIGPKKFNDIMGGFQKKINEEAAADPSNASSIFEKGTRNLRDYTSKILDNQTNIDAKGRKHVMNLLPEHAYRLENLSHQEIKEGLDHWNSKDQEKATSMASDLFHHENLSPDLAQDLLTGKYGKIEPNSYSSYSNDKIKDSIHKRPEIFTPEVIRAGLSARPEFIHPDTAHSLASSPNLNPDNWDELLDNLDPQGGGDDHHRKVFNQVLSGMYRNPNLSKEHINEALKSNDFHDDAIHNPALTDEDLINHSSQELGEESGLHKDKFLTIARVLRKRDLLDKAVSSVKDLGLAKELLGHVDYSDRKKFYEKNLEKFAKDQNDNPKVLSHIMKEWGSSMPMEVRTKVSDGLLDHPDHDVRSAAYRWMSPEKKNTYIEKYGDSDPEVISRLDQDKLQALKVHGDSNPEVVRAILNSQHVTHDQHKAALHHPDVDVVADAVNKAARLVRAQPYMQEIKNGYRNEKKESLRAQNKSQIEETKKMNDRGRELLNITFQKHAKNDDIMMGLNNTLHRSMTHADYRRAMVNHPEISHKVKSQIIADHEYAFDKEHLEPYKDSDDEDMIHSLSNHPNIDKDFFNHMSKRSTPSTAFSLARSRHLKDNPEGAKYLAKHGDEDTNVALVDNRHVDPKIKETLLKDPNVLLRASGSSATDEHLDSILESHAPNDSKLYSKIAAHSSSTDDLRSKTIKMVGKHLDEISGEDGEPDSTHPDYEHYVNAIYEAVKNTKDKRFHGEAQRVIAKHGDDNTVKRFLSMKAGRTVDPKFPEIVSNRFHDGIRSGKVEQLLSLRFKNPEVSKKLIEEAASAGNFGEVGIHIRQNNLDDETHGLAYNALKNDGMPYNTGKGELLKQLLRKGHSEITSELLDAHPDLISEASTNKRIDGAKYKESFHKFVDRLVENDYTDVKNSELISILKNPHIDSDDLDKAYEKIKQGNEHSSNALKHKIANEPKTSENTLSKMWNSLGTKTSIAALSIIKHRNIPKEVKEEVLKKDIEEKVSASRVAMNPTIRIKDFDHVLDQVHGQDDDESRSAFYKELASNTFAHSDDLAKVYEHVNKDAEDAEYYPYRGATIQNLKKNINTPEHVLMSMLENGQATKEELIEHPVVGGKIFRAEKHEFPNTVPNLQAGSHINEVHYKPKQEKYKAVIGMMTEEGMDWATFKKKEPKLSADPDIQKMFTSQPKQRLTKEAGEKYFDNLEGNKFHISYRHWNGMQRHDPSVNQLVLQVNNHEDHDKELKKDPDLYKLYKMAQAGSVMSQHPVGPHTLAWSRIDTSNKDHWFIDEAQSDMNSSLSKVLRELEEEGQASSLKSKYGLTPEQAEALVPKLQEVLRNWDKAVLSGAIELARRHGAKRISMHSGESKTAFNKPGEEVTNKYNKIYNDSANAVGLKKKVRYSTVPNHDKNKASASIWTMALDGSDEGEDTKKSYVSFDIRDLMKSVVQHKKK